MPRTHLEQISVPDPKLPPSLTAFADCLKTSYFYPSGSYEKCEDPRVPGVWSETLSGKFGPYIKGYRYFSVIRVTAASSAYFELAEGERAVIIPIRIADSGAGGTGPQVSWKPLVPGYVTYLNQDFQVSGVVDFVLVMS